MWVSFRITCFELIFFQSTYFVAAVNFIKRIFTDLGFELQFLSIEIYTIEMLLILGIFILLEWFHRNFEHPFTGEPINLQCAAEFNLAEFALPEFDLAESDLNAPVEARATKSGSSL